MLRLFIVNFARRSHVVFWFGHARPSYFNATDIMSLSAKPAVPWHSFTARGSRFAAYLQRSSCDGTGDGKLGF
jgi:hypothetical protein